jgi:hypothetical protein
MRYLNLTLAAIVLFTLLPLAVYVAGYYWLGERLRWCVIVEGEPCMACSDNTQVLPGRLWMIERRYPQQWLAAAYGPAAKVEHWMLGTEVESDCVD